MKTECSAIKEKWVFFLSVISLFTARFSFKAERASSMRHTNIIFANGSKTPSF